MSREKKAQVITSLEETFTRCDISILTDYRGLNTAEITDLRRRLQKVGNEYRVVKNTLARFAAERTGRGDLISLLEGPIAIAFGYGDIAAAARILADFTRDTGITPGIRGGFLDGELISAEDVNSLAWIPSREVLISQVIGQMKGPAAALVGCLTAPMRGMVGVLQSRIKQLEGE